MHFALFPTSLKLNAKDNILLVKFETLGPWKMNDLCFCIWIYSFIQKLISNITENN